MPRDDTLVHGHPATDPVTYYGLKNQALDDPAGFQAVDLTNHMAQLKPADYHELQQLQSNLRNGQPPADLPLQQVYKANTGRMLQQLGLPTNNSGDPQAVQAAQLRRLSDLHLAAEQAATGKPVTPNAHREMLQQIISYQQPVTPVPNGRPAATQVTLGTLGSDLLGTGLSGGNRRNADQILHNNDNGSDAGIDLKTDAGGVTAGNAMSQPTDANNGNGIQLDDASGGLGGDVDSMPRKSINATSSDAQSNENLSRLSPLTGAENHDAFSRGRSEMSPTMTEPPTFIFRLNGRGMSALQDAKGSSFAAFSGYGSAVNDPAWTADENTGPLPKGTYYIVARKSGGVLGGLRDYAYKLYSQLDKNEWFALYRADDSIDDHTSIDGVTRGNFRLHPIGPKGISEGCITISDKADFEKIRQRLLSGGTRLIPNTNIPYYGTVLVK